MRLLDRWLHMSLPGWTSPWPGLYCIPTTYDFRSRGMQRPTAFPVHVSSDAHSNCTGVYGMLGGRVLSEHETGYTLQCIARFSAAAGCQDQARRLRPRCIPGMAENGGCTVAELTFARGVDWTGWRATFVLAGGVSFCIFPFPGCSQVPLRRLAHCSWVWT